MIIVVLDVVICFQIGPHFVQELVAEHEVEEGLPLHLECKVEPISDNSLKVEWFKDGRPLPHGKNIETISVHILTDIYMYLYIYLYIVVSSNTCLPILVHIHTC